MYSTQRKHLRLSAPHFSSVACRCLALVVIALLLRVVILSTVSSFGRAEERDSVLNRNFNVTVKGRFLEVPQIVWGLNNQKIAFARACLTARMLNRTLLMPSLSASLFYKEIDQLQPISFDNVFKFETFNSICQGFVQLSGYSEVSNQSDVLEIRKGSGRRWTSERDLDQLRHYSKDPYADHETVRILGKNPFLWHDHWSVKDYARIFECLVFVDEIVKEADKVVTRIRETGWQATHKSEQSQNIDISMLQKVPYVAVHMRIEKDWMIHCKKLEQRSNMRVICSSKKHIVDRVGNIKGLSNPTVVYLAVADSLLEDDAILDGWREGLVPCEKKKLGLVDIYNSHPYLIRSAIDYLVCVQSNVFVGNSFSTFSSLVVLDRTQKMVSMGEATQCGAGAHWPSYAYNMEGDLAGPRAWATNMSDSSLQAISYGTNHVSC